MLSHTALALLGFIGWTLALVVLMEVLRAWLVLSGQVAANRIAPDNAGMSPFMQRLARVHANCIEGLPVFGGLLLAALVLQRSEVTDPLALWLLGARVVQSCLHLASLHVMVVNLRFTAFMVQVGIGVWWCWSLLGA